MMTEKPTRGKFTIQMDPLLHQRLRRAAFEADRTHYEIVAEALRRYLPELERAGAAKGGGE